MRKPVKYILIAVPLIALMLVGLAFYSINYVYTFDTYDFVFTLSDESEYLDEATALMFSMQAIQQLEFSGEWHPWADDMATKPDKYIVRDAEDPNIGEITFMNERSNGTVPLSVRVELKGETIYCQVTIQMIVRHLVEPSG